ncbi:hypothetical protein H5T89_06015 [bacterium]|nr:hypothetical protein [bacterium]
MSPYYSNTGRPAKFQAEILRSLVAMTYLKIYSTNNRYDLPLHFILPHLAKPNIVRKLTSSAEEAK